MRRIPRVALLIVLIAGFCLCPAQTQPPAPPGGVTLRIPAAAQPSAHFDPEAATEAYLATLPPEARSRSDAYFEGGYWLILWDFLCTAAISLLLLETRWSARMRDWAGRLTRFSWLRTAAYWVQYLLVTTVLGFPLVFYEDYLREHQYGLATQTFGPWMGDQLKLMLLELILGGIVLAVLFAIVRRLPRTWWAWGSLVTIGFFVLQIAIAPVFVTPLFNKVTTLQDPRITGPILRMARASGIPANDVYQIDASRQSTRVSANVSGFGATTRITLNDNLLRRCSHEAVLAVMGHEMCHYVMNHIPRMILEYSVLIVLAFGFLYWALGRSLGRWGHRWQVHDAGDPAVLPLIVLLISAIVLVMSPITNTMSRTQEVEADIFGLNAARQPDGFAEAILQVSEYRKMHPGPIEEFLFYDHPSGYNRIHAAMVWKSQNLDLCAQPAPVDPAPSGQRP